jgi:hypothetical protein
MTHFRLGAITLFSLISSNAWADLRTFDVGLQYQQEVYAAIRDALNPQFQGGDSKAYGTAELLPNGQILVNAQPQALVQLEEVIKAIRERPVAPAQRVSLRYWAVFGSRTAANAANAVGTAPPAVLNDVLAELKRLSGDLTFRVIGSAAVLSESGQRGEVEGMTLSIKQTAYAQGDVLNASIEMDLLGSVPIAVAAPAPPVPEGIEFHIGTLKVRTSLQRGEFVVLGESAVQGGGLNGPVFYIVHWANE